MELCNKCYIVHDERDCPMCSLKDRISDLEKEVIGLEKKLNEKEF